MFFDPGTKTETKADPLSLDSLIAWLEKQRAGAVYCYEDHGQCLAAQYNRSIDRDYSAPLCGWPPTAEDDFDYRLEWIALQKPRTFGAALERARKLAG